MGLLHDLLHKFSRHENDGVLDFQGGGLELSCVKTRGEGSDGEYTFNLVDRHGNSVFFTLPCENARALADVIFLCEYQKDMNHIMEYSGAASERLQALVKENAGLRRAQEQEPEHENENEQ